MAPWTRKTWEFEADLYPEQENNFLGMAIHTKQGEIEIEGYENGKVEMEIEIFGLKIPDNSEAALLIDKKRILEFPIHHGRYKNKHLELGELSSEINIGSAVEIQFSGKTLLSGIFKAD